jgi:predicted transposase YdaD
MPHAFDAANKYILDAYPADWIALAGLPAGSAARVVDADFSTVSRAADKLILVEGAEPYLAHLEFQSGPDGELDSRVLVYNVLAFEREKLPVKSVVFLHRPQALVRGVIGRVVYGDAAEHRLEFTYKLVRVWELRPEALLAAGIGTLPLAPISAVREADLPGLIDAMKVRFDQEVSPERVPELWVATGVLMGLRYSDDIVLHLLRGIRQMRESTVYQAILREGLDKGREEGREEGRADEARSLLLRIGTRQFGPPDVDVRTRLDAVNDLGRLESLMDRMVDKTVTSWAQLLGE